MKGRKLDAATIAQKTTGKPETVKNLNLWGCDLEDVSYLAHMPQLEVISLSVNRISTLRDFASCKKLQELYLRKNSIENIKEIKYLIGLPDLKVLWLHDNPCAQIENYRLIVLKYLPGLLKLDDNMVTQEQKALAKNINFSLNGYPEAPETSPHTLSKQYIPSGQVPNIPQSGERTESSKALIKGPNTKNSKRSHTLQALKLLMLDLDSKQLEELEAEVRRLLSRN